MATPTLEQLTASVTTPVMVTGATGYVAGWVVKRLLDLGLTVHATVRDPDSLEKLAHLNAAAAEAPGTIRYFKADLLAEGAFDEAMAGCGVVFHTASPFKTDVKDPQAELVDPAEKGTRNVLGSADRTPSVTRVVVTSSCAAIYGDNADVAQAPGGVLTEAVWNTSSSLQHQAYSYSKTVAERAAWAMAEAQGRWRLVTVNPSLVMGPGLNPRGTSESFTLLKQLGDGTMKAGVPDIGMGVVDVRDLAGAHLKAGFLPDAAGRHIVSGHNSSFPQMAAALVPEFGDAYPIPRKTLPKWLVWLVGPLANKALTRKAVSRNVGWSWRADNTKSREALGVTYRPLGETMTDFFRQLMEAGQI